MNAELAEIIRGAIFEAIKGAPERVLPPGLTRDEIAEIEWDFLTFGEYVTNQIPYSDVAQNHLDLPDIPSAGAGQGSETPRVRKVGVLKENWSQNRLPTNAHIPGGDPDSFHYASLTQNWNRVDKYVHNIVKTIRFEYRIKNRPMVDDNGNPDRDENGNPIPSRGFILIKYSGADP